MLQTNHCLLNPIVFLGLCQDQKQHDEGFKCPEEFGYYPHPNDCSQYYVCVFGGALLESCTGGLMYRYAFNCNTTILQL